MAPRRRALLKLAIGLLAAPALRAGVAAPGAWSGAARAASRPSAHDASATLYHEISPPWPGALTRVGPRWLLIETVDGVVVEGVWSDESLARVGARFEPGPFEETGATWRLESDGPPLRVLRGAIRRHPEQTSFDVERPAIRTMRLLEIDRDLVEGETITARAERSGEALGFTVSRAARSAAIHTPHHGWTPDSPDAHAMVGLWIATQATSDLWLSERVRYGLLDAETGDFAPGWSIADGRTLVRARAGDDRYALNVAQNDWRTGFDVYVARLPGLVRPGRYRVAVEGLGASRPFAVDRDVHLPLMRHLGRGLIYIQHDDAARARAVPATLASPPTLRRMRFVATARTYASISPDGIGDQGKLWSTPIPPETDPQLVAFGVDHPTEGMRDAGDHDIRPQHLLAATEMLALSLVLPRFDALRLDRAESGQGYDKTIRGRRVRSAVPLSDVFHTALYCGDAWTRMQVDTDGPWRGAVRGGFEMPAYMGWRRDFQSWAGRFKPDHQVHLLRPDPWASFAYAGFAATAAIKFAHVGDAAMRDVYAARARAAWDWAVAHEAVADPPGWRPEWRAHRHFRDARAAASVALWGLTDEDGFHDAWERTPGHAVARHGAGCPTGARLYLALDLAGLRAARAPKRAAIHRDAYETIFAPIARRRPPEETAFERPLGPDGAGEWGSTLNVPYAAHRDHLTLSLMAAHPGQRILDVAARRRLRGWIEAEISYVAGRNPMGRATITGFGYDPPRSIHFADWKGLGLSSPAPGLVAPGLISARRLADLRLAEHFEPAADVTPYPLRMAHGEGVATATGEFSLTGTLWPTLVAAALADLVGVTT